MKLTHKKLREMILEEIENLSYDIEKSKTDEMLEFDHPSEVKSREDAWAGGNNLHHDICHLSSGGSKEKPTRGIERLQIVEAKRLIRHTLTRPISELKLLNKEDIVSLKEYQKFLKANSRLSQEEKVKFTKEEAESLSRGSLYRQKYYGRY